MASYVSLLVAVERGRWARSNVCVRPGIVLKLLASVKGKEECCCQ